MIALVLNMTGCVCKITWFDDNNKDDDDNEPNGMAFITVSIVSWLPFFWFTSMNNQWMVEVESPCFGLLIPQNLVNIRLSATDY